MRFNWMAWYRYSLAGVAVLLFMFIFNAEGITIIGAASQIDNPHTKETDKPLNMTVILERVYLDGEISQEVVHEKCWSMENFWAKYDQWQLTDMDESTLTK
jgi:forespore regulator of the sigma-K checkpoint